MKLYSDEELAEILDQEIFHQISAAADSLGVECYVVGGYVRDIFLERPSNDIDVVVVGKPHPLTPSPTGEEEARVSVGIAVAKELKRMLGRKAHLSVFKNFGTAQVKVYRGRLKVDGGGRIPEGQEQISFNTPPSTLHQEKSSTLHQLKWNRTNVISRPGMQLVVPYGYVGVDTPIDLTVEQRDGLSPVYQFSKRSLPLFYDAELSIAARREVNDPDKLFIGQCFDEPSQPVCLGGTIQDGWVTAPVRDLGGSYMLYYDDVPPLIEPMSIDAGGLLRFEIRDELSGVQSYKAYVDDRFVLFKAQTQSLTVNPRGATVIACRLANTPVQRTGKERRLKLVVTDRCNNQNTYETTIKY